MATGLSVGTTLAGVGLLAATSDGNSTAAGLVGIGLILSIGPSAGHLYAGDYSHATFASVGRGAALAGFTLGLLGTLLDEDGDGGSAAPALMLLGVGTYLGLTFYDWADADDAVVRVERRSRKQLALAPWVGPQQTGLVLAGAF
jgi:hypothetical protein